MTTFNLARSLLAMEDYMARWQYVEDCPHLVIMPAVKTEFLSNITYVMFSMQFRAVGSSRANLVASWCCCQVDKDNSLTRQRHEMRKKECYFASFVEYVTCVNTVSNNTVLYDHKKHIRFPQILVLLWCSHLYFDYSCTFSDFFECFILFVTYSIYQKEVVGANCLECTDWIRSIYGCLVDILLLLHYINL
jgi:hypothetical protein